MCKPKLLLLLLSYFSTTITFSGVAVITDLNADNDLYPQAYDLNTKSTEKPELAQTGHK